MDKKRIVELRAKAQSLRPTLFVGKEGVSDHVIAELSNQLRKNLLVKAKLLSSVQGDKEAIGRELADKTRSILVETRGRTVVLARERTKVHSDHG
jgi:RNA-binding protein